jgi:hypothetical protein
MSFGVMVSYGIGGFMIVEKIKKYQDKTGAICLAPCENGEQDSENALLFTGEIALLCALVGIESLKGSFENAVLTRQIKNFFGLFNRYTDGHRNRSTSWDEYNGIMFVVSSDIDNLRYIAENIVDYGKDHNWAYVNEDPGLKPRLFDPSSWPYIGRIRQPRCRCFYKVCAGIIPNWTESYWLAQSIKIDANDTIQETSGNLMTWLRMKAMHLNNYHNEIVDNANIYWIQNMISQYGKYPLRAMAKIYFKDANHPIHDLITMYYDKTGGKDL